VGAVRQARGLGFGFLRGSAGKIPLPGGKVYPTRFGRWPKMGVCVHSGQQAMKIAQVAPLYESVPPKCYGGTERVVSYLTEELVYQGHEVTLFASGDSVTQARLVAPCRRSLRLDRRCVDQAAHHLVMLEQLFARAHEFDAVHFHVDYIHFPLSRRQPLPHLTTLHGRLDIPDLVPLYRTFGDTYTARPGAGAAPPRCGHAAARLRGAGRARAAHAHRARSGARVAGRRARGVHRAPRTTRRVDVPVGDCL